MQLPRLESRLSAQERQTSLLTARVEELAEDTAESIRQLSMDKTSFKEVDAYLRVIEATMATKKDIAELKTEHSKRFDHIERVQAEHSKHFDKVDARLDNIERAQAEHGDLLRGHGDLLKEILARLPKPPDSE